MGIIWGLRYIKQTDKASKLVGLFVIVLTIIELVWLIQSTVYMVNTANQQINQQFRLYGL